MKLPRERKDAEPVNGRTNHPAGDPGLLRGDLVDEASQESFPASDPPSWAPLRSGPPADVSRRDTTDDAAR